MPQDAVPIGSLAAFLAEGVSVVASSCNAANRPAVARALDCRIAPDGRRVTLLVAASACDGLLRGVAETGRIAVAITKPSTHRCIQIKGDDARTVPPPADARPGLSGHIDAFVRDVTGIGFDETLVRTLMAYDPADLVAVVFTPSGLFDQTPGPRAGSPLAP